MKNPFSEVIVKPEPDLSDMNTEFQLKLEKRDALYARFDPVVNQILGDFISAHRSGLWKLDSDSSRPYCCHISWFAGPEEKPRDPYDVHHTIRRRIEITLETDGLCNPTGYRIVNYEAIEKTIHVGLEPQNLVEGILAVMG